MKTWIGDCHLIKGDGEKREDFQTRAAVLCPSREDFDRLLQRHVNAQGVHILWTQNVQEVTQWLTKNGHDNAVMRLAKSVDENTPVALAETTAVDEHGNPLPEPGYLTITEHEIEPLPNQSGIPFWDQEWIAPDLKELLFGQPQKGGKLRTYFIVDASLRKNITGVFDLDTIDIPIQCLFKGDAAEDLKEAAPYLIDMTLPDGAWDDRDKVPAFHRDFFARHWGQNTGIFIRTTALMAEVWGHFRRFPRIQVEADKRWVFFRFWDPRIAPSYFDSIKDIPEKCTQWADMRGNRIERIIGNQTDSDQAWSVTPIWDNLEGFASIGQPMLSEAEMQGFERYKLEKFDRETARELCRAYSAMGCDEAQFRELTRIVRTWSCQYGIMGERDITRLVHLAIALGAEFPKDARFANLAAILGNTKKSPNWRVKYCVNDAQTWLATIWEGQMLDELHARLMQCINYPTENYHHRDALSKFVWQLNTRYIDNADNKVLDAFVNECASICDSHNITSRYARITYILCAFIYGQNFATDPLREPLANCFNKQNSDNTLRKFLTDFFSQFGEVSHATG